MNTRFGKYELLRRIGVGGMAEVFVARTRGAEGFVKDVVIKRLLPGLTEEPGFVRMFIAEARVAAALHHANIVQVFDFDQADGSYYIAMEWVDGADLSRINAFARQRGTPLPQILAVHVGCESLKGLHYAHGKSDESGAPLQLIHRDISPQNLLVSRAAEVKIADFGIAKAAAHASITRTGEIKGKLGYMSPEQVRGGTIDHRSDIFSLGLVLWELLAGDHPYLAHSSSDAALIAAVERAEIPALAERCPHVDRELAAVVQRMLEPAADRRPATALDALELLSRHVDAADVLALPEYLEELLTQDAPRPADIADAAPDPPRTVLPPAAAPEDAPSAAAARPRPARGGAPHRGTARVQGAALPPRLVLRAALAGSAAFALCAFGVGWLVASSRAEPAPPPAAARSMATVDIRAWPGAALTVDGVEIGRHAALRLSGPAAARLRVVAREGERSAAREIALTDGARVALVAAARPTSRTSRSAAGAPDPRPPAKATSHHRAAPRRAGALDVIVSPWAEVFLDGKPIGTTPIKGHAATVGRHRLRLVNPPLGKDERLTIRVREGVPLSVKRSW